MPTDITDTADRDGAGDPRDGSGSSVEPGSQACRVPSVSTIDGFTEVATQGSGIVLNELLPRTTLRVLTENSCYRIIVVDPCERKILVEGGQFFPRRTAARLCGATFGGSFLKLGAIVLGMRMEIMCGDGIIVTSSVRNIALRQAQGDAGAGRRLAVREVPSASSGHEPWPAMSDEALRPT